MKKLNTIATALSGGIGIFTLVSLVFLVIRDGGLMLDARPEPALADAGTTALLFIWAATSALAYLTKR
jgi:hypothetical protein